MVFPVGWGRKVALTIPAAQVSGTGTHTGFPVLITRANLPDEMCDPSGINAAQSDGGDLRASSDEAGTTQLPLEVVDFGHDSSTGAGDAAVELWVKRDLNTASDTVIYLWYNEATASQPAVTDAAGRDAVWSDYVAVFHGDDGTDSAGNGYDVAVTGAGAAVGQATAKIGKAFQVGSADGVRTSTLQADVLNSANTIVLQSWVNRTVDSTFGSDFAEPIVWFRDDSVPDGAGLGIGSSTADVDNKLFLTVAGDGDTRSAGAPNTSMALDTWYLTHSVYEPAGNTVDLYVNGSLDLAVTGFSATAASATEVIIGVTPNDTASIEGYIDEVRVRLSFLSAAWVSTEYANHNSPSTFITTGTPEAPASTTDASVTAASSGADSYVALVTLSASVSSAVSATASYSAVSQIVVTLTEAVSAQDSDAGPAQALASISAGTTGNDLLDAVAQAAAAITAGAAAGELWVSETQAPGIEDAVVAEGTTAGAAFVAAVSVIAELTGASSVSDAAAATIVAIGSVSEGVAASDTNSVVGQILAAINESAAASAIYTAATSGDILVSLSAGATASDSWVGTGPSGYLVAGAIAITAGLTATVSFSPAFDASIEINPN